MVLYYFNLCLSGMARESHLITGSFIPSSDKPLADSILQPPMSLPEPTRVGVPDSLPVVRGVSLIIPAYNEEDRISPTLEAYSTVLMSRKIPHEILVIMDGIDRTPEVVARYRDRNVVGYRYAQKMGRGGAVLEGFRRAHYPVVGFADADGSVPPDDFGKLLDMALSGEDAVIASRRLNPSIVKIPETRLRRIIGSLWHALVKMILQVEVMDAQCGLKFFSRDAIRLIIRKVTVTNRTFEVGMLYHVSKAGFRIKEVPVAYVHDFRTRMPVGKAIPVMFLTLVGIAAANTMFKDRKIPRMMLDLNRRFKSI